MKPYQLFIDSLQVRFLHLQEYTLDYRWRIRNKPIEHTVLWVIEKGALILNIDDIEHNCNAGDACLIPESSILTSRTISSEVVIASINFDSEITYLSRLSWTKALHLPVVFVNGAAGVQEILSEMRNHSRGSKQSPFLSLIMQAGLLRILYVLLNGCKQEQIKPDYEGTDMRIHTIVDFLLCHQDHMPEVAELAGLVSLSESHLRKLFIQHTGFAPLQFVHRHKIEQAKQRLISSNQTVAQIALELGIRNINYFSRLFKAKSGLTPQQYRHQFRM